MIARVRHFVLNELDHESFCRKRVNDAEMVKFIGLITAHRLNMAHQFGF
jgi:hypothetical protein